MATRFRIPQWSPQTMADNVPTLAEVVIYVAKARGGQGLTDEELADDINDRWPDLLPGGASVRTDADGVVWVSSEPLEIGDQDAWVSPFT